MNHTWFVLQHVEWEGPGLIAEEATARGLSLETCRLDLGMTLPDATGVGGLIAMGGPMGVYESERYPFLDEECRLIREMVDDGRPVLGVCLGAQLLAHALGGRVFPGPSPEIGLGPVRLTDGGKQDPVLGPAGDSFSAFHWHGDTFDLPANAELLASSSKYSNQAIRKGRCAYGLQFHVEPDFSTWSAWQSHLSKAYLVPSEPDQRELERRGRGIIARFFDLALQ